MCAVCDEFGHIGCPACGFDGVEKEPEAEAVECKTCGGEGYFYFDAQTQKHIDRETYDSFSIYRKRDVEVYECGDCSKTFIV